MARIALGIEYDGSAYAGWQQQAHARSVQDALQASLAGIAGHAVHLTAAGRTDAGVHALLQVAHFDTSAARPAHAWTLGGTAGAPDDVSVLWSHEVPEYFHARHCALSRTYLYRILNRRVRPAIERQRVCWIRRPLDVAAMRSAGQRLLGERDFSSFRAAECQSKTAMRRLIAMEVVRSGAEVRVVMTANAFLYHMVRNIVGSLLMVGTGQRPDSWLFDVLETRNRTCAGPTAPPQGLYFAGVDYPPEFALPCYDAASGRLRDRPPG
jgi:tRNA pseudouridine38-40 synthase